MNPLLAIIGNGRAFRGAVAAAKRVLAAGPKNKTAQRLFAKAVGRAAGESGVDPSDIATGAMRVAQAEAKAKKNPKAPKGRKVHPLAFEARDRYLEDTEAGHSSAAEYWRGQAGAFFTGNNPHAITWVAFLASDYGLPGAQTVDVEAASYEEAKSLGAQALGTSPTFVQATPIIPRQDLVAGGGVGGRVKSSRARSPRVAAPKGTTKRVKKNRTNSSQEVAPEKKRTFTLDEARSRFEGFDAAKAVIEEFHGHPPGHVELFAIDDGKKEITVDRVHAALHRTLETNYMVPWENSNKHGTLWKHEHKEGKGLKGLERGKPLPNPEDLPLEIYDPATKTTRKIGGKFQIRDWWFD